MGEQELAFKFVPAAGQFQLRGSAEALKADGGLVAAVGLQSSEPLCACPQKPGRPHTEAITSRYELRLTPAKLVLSARRKIIKLALGGKFACFLKQAYQAYQRLEQWQKQTAPQLSQSMGKLPPWLRFDPTQASPSAVT